MSYREVVRGHEKVKYNPRSFFLLHHTHYNKDTYMEPHWHNSLEVTYVVKGEKSQFMNNQKVIAKTDDLLLVNSGIKHDIDVKKGLEGIVLLIDIHFIEYFCPQCINHFFNLDLNLEAKQQIINYLIELVQQYENHNTIRCHIIVLEIIDILATKLLEKDYCIKEKHDDETYELVMIIEEYLEYHYMQHICLDDIAEMINYNKSYLSSIFKKKTGLTIFEYLKNIRMQHVLDDLKFTNETIVNIAFNNGFANIQVFNHDFKELYQMTPMQYRKLKNKNNFIKK